MILLQQLNYIYMIKNGVFYLTSLPELIGMLFNLQILNLYNNKLTRLPESIGSLSNLKYLDLSENKPTRIL